MGFERVTSMIQGTKNFTDFENAKISNYETDVFRPLFDELEKITGKTYKSTLPKSAQNLSEDEKVDVAFRVIADHIRTLSFSIADGIQPSNEGRGYVLRRILRRAVRYGRNLGLREPFLGKLVDVLGATMGHVFPEVVAKADLIKKTLTNEEESFLRTLERGIHLFDEAAEDAVRNFESEKEVSLGLGLEPDEIKPSISGEQAFELYDTYGFPLDLTELMARERGMSVKKVDFEMLMAEQRHRSQSAQKKEVIQVAFYDKSGTVKTEFDGYENIELKSEVIATADPMTEGKTPSYIVPRKTPFYLEMGGQVGDLGEIVFESEVYKITGLVKKDAAVLHQFSHSSEHLIGKEVVLRVDAPRRAKIEAHHSVTHIMHWALRKVLGTTVSQKGSYVGPDRLRFDFSHGTHMTPEEIAEVEKLVNEKIEADLPVAWDERPYAQVKGDPSILQFFGDKYGEMVRVVSIGDFSKELCGGTHVRQSGKIGYFKILHESAIAAGIRRIEAMSGEALRLHVDELLKKQDESLEGRAPARPSGHEREAARTGGQAHLSPSLQEMWQLYKSREKQLHDLELVRIQNEKDAAKKQEAEFQKRAATEAPELIASAKTIHDVPFIAKQIDAPAAYLPVLADALKSRWQGVAVLAAADVAANKVALLAAVAPAYTKKVQAGKIIQTIAPLVGGKGGGRPELAQGGGTHPAGIPEALAKAETLL
jgi:alanyl-tRNA synthetase